MSSRMKKAILGTTKWPTQNLPAARFDDGMNGQNQNAWVVELMIEESVHSSEVNE